LLRYTHGMKTPKNTASRPAKKQAQKIAVIGAGIAGIACSRTLAQAGHLVHVFEKSAGLSGRMSTRRTPFGSFDHGAQYFTVRDPRFLKALSIAPQQVAIWKQGREKNTAMVAQPGMSALVNAWAYPLMHDQGGKHTVDLDALVQAIEPDVVQKKKWQIRTQGPNDTHHVDGGFDAVILAVPSVQAHALLAASGMNAIAQPIAKVEVAPCWTMMLAFPQAADHMKAPIGPNWSAKRVDHARIGWLARESSKPGRELTERWTVQAQAEWSQEHLEDDPETVKGKLLRAFTEITGIKAEPTYAEVHRWRYSQTIKPLGKSFIWNDKKHIGVCGDWCIGHRVEDAFISGLELALAVL
jgi:renalase